MFSVKKSILVSAMEKCFKGVGHTLKETDSFAFKSGMIASYSNNVSVSVPIPFDIFGCVNAEKALKLFSSLDEDIIVVIHPDKWEVVSGTTRAYIPMYATPIFEYIDAMQINECDFQPIPSNFFEAIQFCSLPKNRTEIDGIFFNENLAISTDSFRISMYFFDNPVPRFWIAEESLKVLNSLKDIKEFRVNHSWVHFKLEDGTSISVKKKHDLLYPYKQIKDIYGKVKETIPICDMEIPDGIETSLKRVSAITSNVLPVVNMHFSKSGLKIEYEGSAGSIEETLNWKTEYPYGDFEVKMNSNFLLNAISKSNKFQFLERLNGNAALIVGDEKTIHIANAMRS